MAEIVRSIVSNFYLRQKVEVYATFLTPYYGTWTGADNYFKTKIRSTVMEWHMASAEDRIAALREATRLMDTLNFIGTPESTLKHFPTVEHGTPQKFDIACYEIALQLLKGIDSETEQRNLSVTSQGFAGSRTTYERSFVQDHIRAGIPSAFAWSILRPYLGDPGLVKLSRGG